MERNFTLILKDISILPARDDGSNISSMDDPELLKYPISYLSEPGYWFPSDSEALGLADLPRQGRVRRSSTTSTSSGNGACSRPRCGRCCRRRRSSASTSRIRCSTASSSIKSLEIPYPGRLGEQGLTGEFYGIHEGNDPSKRLMVVINYNMDIGDYMEHSGRGLLRGGPDE